MNVYNKSELIYPDLSFIIVGICFKVHNELDRYGREKQYADLLETRFTENDIAFKRELMIGDSGNIVDFLIDDKVILELKAKPVITKEDYYQIQRYLQSLNIRLGLLINFRDKYLRPKRIIKIETKNRNNFFH